MARTREGLYRGPCGVTTLLHLLHCEHLLLLLLGQAEKARLALALERGQPVLRRLEPIERRPVLLCLIWCAECRELVRVEVARLVLLAGALLLLRGDVRGAHLRRRSDRT